MSVLPGAAVLHGLLVLLVLRLLVVPLLLVGWLLITGLLIVGLLAQTTVRKAAALNSSTPALKRRPRCAGAMGCSLCLSRCPPIPFTVLWVQFRGC